MRAPWTLVMVSASPSASASLPSRVAWAIVSGVSSSAPMASAAAPGCALSLTALLLALTRLPLASAAVAVTVTLPRPMDDRSALAPNVPSALTMAVTRTSGVAGSLSCTSRVTLLPAAALVLPVMGTARAPLPGAIVPGSSTLIVPAGALSVAAPSARNSGRVASAALVVALSSGVVDSLMRSSSTKLLPLSSPPPAARPAAGSSIKPSRLPLPVNSACVTSPSSPLAGIRAASRVSVSPGANTWPSSVTVSLAPIR